MVTRSLLLIGLALALVGCSGDKKPTTVLPKATPTPVSGAQDAGGGRNAILQMPFDQAAKLVMMNIGKAYEMACIEKPPKNHDDLGQPKLETNRDLQKKPVEVLYGVDIRKLGEDAANRMLAWEKDPDANGGRMVLMADCKTVKYLGEDEFKNTPKAK